MDPVEEHLVSEHLVSEHYDQAHVDFLEALWGEGWLSPGGAGEVQMLLEGLDLAGLDVLDIGCGSGGVSTELVTTNGASSVVGIDVEATVLDNAITRVEAAGLVDRIELHLVEPGRIPLDDARFDVVFSKDSIVHIADKEALAVDVFRLLKPGGWFVASDWMITHDGEPSTEMAHYLKLEDLGFGMASPARYRRALAAAGFVGITMTNRNDWYREAAREERRRIATDRRRFDATIGRQAIDAQLETGTPCRLCWIRGSIAPITSVPAAPSPAVPVRSASLLLALRQEGSAARACCSPCGKKNVELEGIEPSSAEGSPPALRPFP